MTKSYLENGTSIEGGSINKNLPVHCQQCYDSGNTSSGSGSCPICLKGLWHQIRIAWKWYCFKGLGMDMRHLIFKNFKSKPSIFNRHLKLLCLGSKSVQISILFWTLFEAAQNGFEFAVFASWMLQELLYLGPEQRLRRLLSSICVQNLYRATPATFRTQIEQWL